MKIIFAKRWRLLACTIAVTATITGNSGATDWATPTEFYLVGVNSETGVVLWEAYDRGEIPDPYRESVPPEFFDREFRRSYYPGWKNRNDTDLTVKFTSTGIGAPEDTFTITLVHEASRKTFGSAEMNGFHVVRSLGDRFFVVDQAGFLFCYRMAAQDGAAWMPEWKRDLFPDRGKLAETEKENPLKGFHSDLRFEGDSSLWVVTRLGIRQYDFRGNRLKGFPSSEGIDFRRYNSMNTPVSGVELKILENGLLVRTGKKFHLVDKETGEKRRWAYPHNFRGFHARSIVPENGNVILLETLDTTPRILRWAVGLPSGSYDKSGRTLKKVEAGLEILRHSGFQYSRNWLEERLSEDWIDEEKNPPPSVLFCADDPFKLRRLYQNRIKPEWEETIEANLKKNWKPIHDMGVLERFCVEGLIEPPKGEIVFDRMLTLETLFERVHGMPNRERAESPYFHFPQNRVEFESTLPALRKTLLPELRRILREGPPEEQFLTAGIFTAQAWEVNDVSSDELLKVINHPGEGIWKWSFYALLCRGERDRAVKAILARPQVDQLLAVSILNSRFYNEKEDDQLISDLELDMWRRLFAKYPMKVSYPLKNSSLGVVVADEIREFLRIEARERKFVNYSTDSALLSLIRLINDFQDPKDNSLIAAFADHPQWREKSLGSGVKEYWIRDRVKWMLQKRGLIPKPEE